MLYLILGTHKKDSAEKRLQARPKHLELLKALENQNRLVLAGPLLKPDGSGAQGGLIVADFETIEAAQRWVDEDAYTLAGIYENVDIKPFEKVLPHGK